MDNVTSKHSVVKDLLEIQNIVWQSGKNDTNDFDVTKWEINFLLNTI